MKKKKKKKKNKSKSKSRSKSKKKRRRKSLIAPNLIGVTKRFVFSFFRSGIVVEKERRT